MLNKLRCYSISVIFLFLIVPLVKGQLNYDTLKYIKFYDQPIWSVYQNYFNSSVSIHPNYVRDSLNKSDINWNAESFKEVGISYSKNKFYVLVTLINNLPDKSYLKPKPKYFNAYVSYSDKSYLTELGINLFKNYYVNSVAPNILL